MVWIKCKSSLDQMYEPLRDANHTDIVLVLGMVLCQLAQNGGQTGVAGDDPDEAQAEDSVVSHLDVVIVGEIGEGVENIQLGV